MNFISVSGNLGKSAELRSLSSGDSVVSFSVADSQGKDKPTIWWSCSMFGKRAESLCDYLVKGAQVTVVGPVSEREWTDRDGAQRKSMEIRVMDIKLQGGKPEGQSAPKAAPATRTADRSMPHKGGSGFDDMDDVPF